MDWGSFTLAQLSELSISLDHRLTEAKSGNAYVWTETVEELLEDLYTQYPEFKVE